MTFQFHTTPVTEDEKSVFARQLAMALDKRLELHSRRTMPGLWSATDRLNSLPKAPAAVRKRRSVRYRVYGVLFLAMGLFLLIPSLMEPQELAVPLAVGTLCVVSGIAYLRPRRKGPSRRERRQAERLLAAMADSGGADVAFDRNGVTIRTEASQRRISDTDMNAVIETEDLFVLSFSRTSDLILKKKDMTAGDPAVFLHDLAERTALPTASVTTAQET